MFLEKLCNVDGASGNETEEPGIIKLFLSTVRKGKIQRQLVVAIHFLGESDIEHLSVILALKRFMACIQHDTCCPFEVFLRNLEKGNCRRSVRRSDLDQHQSFPVPVDVSYRTAAAITVKFAPERFCFSGSFKNGVVQIQEDPIPLTVIFGQMRRIVIKHEVRPQTLGHQNP